MKLKLKYSHVIYTVAATLIISLILTVIFWRPFEYSGFSLISIALALIMIINAILAIVYKHKGNFFLRKMYLSSILSKDRDYTFTDEYENKFRLTLLVHCGVIPFYLPVILVTQGWTQSALALSICLIPEAFFLIYQIGQTFSDAKKEMHRQQQQDKERIEQEKREELGRFR